MQIAILEDDAQAAALLSGLLVRYAREQHLKVHLAVYRTAAELLSAFDATPADIAFLDIYLEGAGNTGRAIGMEVAWHLKEHYPHCKLVFATSSSLHAVESYSIRAAFYLTKPLEYGKLCAAMGVACTTLQRESQCIRLPCAGTLVEVPLREVIYMDCVMEQAVLHLMDKVLTVDGLVGETLTLLLADKRFLLCNRNLAVNMDWIAETQKDKFLLKNGVSIPIRQHGRPGLRRAYMAYRMGHIQGSRDT